MREHMEYSVSAADVEKEWPSENSRVNEILQNVALILATPKGSSPMYRDFGLSQEFVDKPLPVAKAQLRVLVKEAIEQWEPRAAYADLTFTGGDPADPAELRPVVRVEILEGE